MSTPTLMSCYRAMPPPPMSMEPSANSSLPTSQSSAASHSSSRTETVTLTMPTPLMPSSSMSQLQPESTRSSRQQSSSVAISIRDATTSNGYRRESFSSHLRKTIMSMYSNPRFRTAYSMTSLLCEFACAALSLYAMIESASVDANFLVFVVSLIFFTHYIISFIFISLRMKYKQMWQNDPFYMTPKIAILRYSYSFFHTIFVLAYGAILYLYSEFQYAPEFSQVHSLRIVISFLIVYEGIFVSLLLAGLFIMTYLFGINRVLNAICPPAWATSEPVVTKVTCPGLTPEQINALPTVRFENGMFDGQLQGCAICLLDIVQGDLVRQLSCNHSFHTECVDAWLGIRASCPLCVRKINNTSGKNTSEKKKSSGRRSQNSVAPRSSSNTTVSANPVNSLTSNRSTSNPPPTTFVSRPSITQQQVELSTSIAPVSLHFETHSHL